MKRFRREHRLFFCFFAAVGVGAVICNSIFAKGAIDYHSLYEYLEQGWKTAIDGGNTVIRNTVVIRIAEAVLVIMGLKHRIRNMIRYLIPVLSGLSIAVILTVLTWSRGITGFLLFVSSAFPHGICYGAVLILLLLGVGNDHVIRKLKFWCVIIGLICIGIVLEITINPFLLQILVT